jgi:hypothetical protein
LLVYYKFILILMSGYDDRKSMVLKYIIANADMTLLLIIHWVRTRKLKKKSGPLPFYLFLTDLYFLNFFLLRSVFFSIL